MRWAGPLGFLFTRAVVVRLRGKYQAEGSSTSLDKVRHVTPLAYRLGPEGTRMCIAGHLGDALRS